MAMKITLTRKKKLPIYNLAEIHQYVMDIDRVTMLRDKAASPDEHNRYANIVNIMQRVLFEIQGGDSANGLE